MRAPIHVRTNAKINLFLRVVGARPDGLHEIETVFHCVGLADELEVSANEEGGFSLEVVVDARTGDHLPSPEENLVARAAEALAWRARVRTEAAIRLVKRIPVGAGLAGGSGNAAGALHALNELWGADLDAAALAEVGAGLGSDVPFCLAGGTVLAGGRGDELTPLPPPATLWFVLGMSLRPLPTRDVYRAFDELGSAATEEAARLVAALARGDVAAIAAALHNDLEAPAIALRPGLAADKAALLDSGALGACVAGSGPTLFGLVPDEGAGVMLARSVEDRFDRVEVVSSRALCVERADLGRAG
ncbi:MAG: 4-(cytidine 5'-diphospho)-2-C-methyl-D-erythritol kinase [Actinomycetota bacterium]